MMNQVVDTDIITSVEDFLHKANLNTRLSGICALTIQLDRSSLTGTFIFDYDNKVMLDHYPARYSSRPIQPIYKTFNGNNWTINLVTGLQPIICNGEASDIMECEECYPFCCSNCNKQYRELPRQWESIFTNFKNRNGTSKYIFRVVKKIQSGDMEYIKYFRLDNSEIIEITPSETEHKINTFKIYKCATHNTYYGVNLLGDEGTYNQHHAKLQNETEFGPQLLSKMAE